MITTMNNQPTPFGMFSPFLLMDSQSWSAELITVRFLLIVKIIVKKDDSFPSSRSVSTTAVVQASKEPNTSAYSPAFGLAMQGSQSLSLATPSWSPRITLAFPLLNHPHPHNEGDLLFFTVLL
jgi:hypothetical protein